MNTKKNILLFKAKPICYDSTFFFAEELANALETLNCEVDICEFEDILDTHKNVEDYPFLKEYTIRNYDMIIDFNSMLPRLQTKDGHSFVRFLNGPFYNYILDHPLYLHDSIKVPLKNYHIICLDLNHYAYLKQYYPHLASVHFLPLAGMVTNDEPAPFEQRRMDFLFTGTYTAPEHVINVMNLSCRDLLKELNSMLEIMQEKPDLTQEQALAELLNDLHGTIETGEFAGLMQRHFLLDTYFHALHRYQIITTLLDAGIKLTVYGQGWDSLHCRGIENLTIHNPVSFSVALFSLSNAKFALNILPNFKNGPHDRIYSAMLNRTVCITDSNSYIDSHFHGLQTSTPEIATFSLNKVDALPDIVEQLRANSVLCKDIIENAYQDASLNHTWLARAKELLSYLSSTDIQEEV